jgi:protein O-mannosyl-transferase
MRQPATHAKASPTRAASAATVRSGMPVWLIGLLLVLVTIALYWPATQCDFVNYDDDLHVTGNLQVQKGLTLESIKWALSTPVNCIWHPMTALSHMLDCQLFGLNPWGHHLSSVLLHAVNTGLVFLLLRVLTGAVWRSVLVAVLFGLHPLRVESVAWIAERKGVLSGFFGLLALLAYARYARERSLKSKVQSLKSGGPTSSVPWNSAAAEGVRVSPFTFYLSRFTAYHGTFYLLALFFFALGLMSKPMLVTWPFVMLLLDYWPLGRMQNAEGRMQNGQTSQAQHVSRNTLLRLVLEKAPFFALAAAASGVTFLVQQRAGALAAGENLPLGARGANAMISYCRYLGKLFWPADLAVAYPHPGHWPLVNLLLAGVLLAGISVLVWAQRRRHPYLLMGWLWYCGILVPVSQVVQTGGHAMADRYTYLPSLGVLILTVWGTCELIRRWRYNVLGFALAGGVVVMLCLALTRHQIGYWKDSEALFRHALAATVNNDAAHNGLGITLDKQGQMKEAIREFQEAIRLKPGYALAHCNLGIALDKTGQVDEAIRQFQEAIRLNAGGAEAYYNLGVVLSRRGQKDEAIRQLQEAIRLKPDYAEAYNDLGIALGRQGQMDEAIRQFQEAARLKLDYAEAHYNLGLALGIKGQPDEAIRQLETALKAKPDYPKAHNQLGLALGRKGRIREAIGHFQEALRLKPDYADARKNLDSVLASKPQSSQPPGAPASP